MLRGRTATFSHLDEGFVHNSQQTLLLYLRRFLHERGVHFPWPYKGSSRIGVKVKIVVRRNHAGGLNPGPVRLGSVDAVLRVAVHLQNRAARAEERHGAVLQIQRRRRVVFVDTDIAVGGDGVVVGRRWHRTAAARVWDGVPPAY